MNFTLVNTTYVKIAYALVFSLMTCYVNAQSLDTRQDYALFFITNEFDNWADFPRSTVQQVEQIETELKKKYGYITEVVTNPTRKEILEKLAEYGKKRFGKHDQLLIYFSQHGYYSEGQIGALVPKDGKKQDPFYESWIMYPLLETLVNKISCEHLLLSIDACYSGTFGGSRGKPTGPVWDVDENCETRAKSVLEYRSRIYITSGGKVRTPTDSEFADKFLEALRTRNQDGIMSFHEFFSVLSEASPSPLFGEFGSHSKGGNFVFLDQEACNQLTERGANLDNNISISKINEIYKSKDYETSFPLFIKYKDHPEFTGEHMKNLGRSYHLGHGTKADYEKALYWYEKAVAKANPHAMNNIGILHLESRFDYSTRELGMKWLLRAIEHGSALAMANYGYYLENGIGVKKNLKEAYRLYSRSAELGNMSGLYYLGMLYYRGVYVRKNYKKAGEFLLESAKLGNVDAMVWLGEMYAKNEEVKPNYDLALKWYSEAEKNGNLYARKVLGDWFLFGRNVQKVRDYQRGVDYFKKAAIQGDTLAQSRLLSIGETWYKPAKGTDTDLDGVQDDIDLCPRIRGRKENRGCPILEKTYSKTLAKKPDFEEAIYKFGIPKNQFYKAKFYLDKTNIDTISFNQSETTVLSKDLPFYPGFSLLYIIGKNNKTYHYLYYNNSDFEDERVISIDYKNEPIYLLNETFPINLNEENVYDYAYFFFSSVAGRHGRFFIMDSAEQIPYKLKRRCRNISNYFEPLLLNNPSSKKETYFSKVSMLFKGDMFVTELSINKNTGVIKLDNEKLFELSTCTLE